MSEELLHVLELFISLHGVVYNHIFTVHSHPHSSSISLPQSTLNPPPLNKYYTILSSADGHAQRGPHVSVAAIFIETERELDEGEQHRGKRGRVGLSDEKKKKKKKKKKTK
ncbi:hypothetical protein ABVT39_008805 [Epinephelus coioides]